MASLSQKYPSIVRKLLVPPLTELCDLLNDKMSSNFAEVNVEVVDCPDLRKEPFHMAGEGLNGKPMIADIGGISYLMPLPRFDKQPYSLTEIAQLMGLQKGLILGAACGPFHCTGFKCEMMPNIHFEVTSNGE
ncbi:ester hydrolase C11orf54-like protein, partial [Leptotrombidium deliense]